MSDKNSRDDAKKNVGGSKAKFREALDKKKEERIGRRDNFSQGPKIQGNHVIKGAPKMFRRKSGSS